MLFLYESTVGEVQRGSSFSTLMVFCQRSLWRNPFRFRENERIVAVGGDRGNYTELYRHDGMDWVQIGQTIRLDPIISVISGHHNLIAIVCTNRNDFHIPKKRHRFAKLPTMAPTCEPNTCPTAIPCVWSSSAPL